MKFRLILIGEGIRFLPYFINAFQQGGQRLGIGQNRGKYELTTIVQFSGNSAPASIMLSIHRFN